MSDFRKFLDEQLEDPEFKAEWDALQPERALVQAMIDARKRTGMTAAGRKNRHLSIRHQQIRNRRRQPFHQDLAASGGRHGNDPSG